MNLRNVYLDSVDLSSTKRQNLSEAAKEIQALLATYNSTTPSGQEKPIAEFDAAVAQHP
jgi:hypothetical protein